MSSCVLYGLGCDLDLLAVMNTVTLAIARFCSLYTLFGFLSSVI